MRADNVLMKEINKDAIRKELRKRHRATKPELAAATGLSVVTVNSIMEEMTAEGEVFVGDSVPSAGGRPSVQYMYHAGFQLAAVIYGHQRKEKIWLRLMVVDLFGECLEEKNGFFDTIKAESFDVWLDEAFSSYPSVRLIAFGLPGEEKDGIIYLNDYPDLVGDVFMRHYRERYKVPVIYENDINASILGYYSIQDSRVIQNAVGIYFPRTYSPGAGAVLHGKLYHGSGNFAGELQYIELPYSWQELDYEKPEELAETVGRLLVIYGCILAPDIVVLYGDFWTKEKRDAITQYVREKLGGERMAGYVFADSPEQDFERGMIKLALNSMERKIL